MVGIAVSAVFSRLGLNLHERQGVNQIQGWGRAVFSPVSNQNRVAPPNERLKSGVAPAEAAEFLKYALQASSIWPLFVVIVECQE